MLASLGLRLMNRAKGLGFRALSCHPGTSQVACLDDVRSVIKLEGAPLVEYLQKIITNDATKLTPGGPPLYACVLTPHGRFMHDMFLHPLEGAQVPTVLVDCDSGQRRALMDLFQRYALHHKVDVSSAGKHYSVWTAFGSGEASPTPAATAAVAATQRWPEDPRLPQLGRRTVLPRGSAPGATSGWKEYQCWRIKQGVAEGDIEIPSGEVVPLEFNLDKLNAISYDKGCYIGQEFVARVHSRGVVRKRVMPFRLGEARGASCRSSVPIIPGRSHVFDVFEEDGSLHAIGRVRAVQGEFGLTKLRLKQAMAAIKERKPLLVGDLESGTGYAELWPWRPEWWEPSWGHEEMPGEDEEQGQQGQQQCKAA